MELKYLVVLSIFGVVSGFTLPERNSQGESSGDLESSFSPISSSSSDVDSSSNLSRDKRGLLFKKMKKHSGSDTVYVNRQYQGSTGYEYRPNREIHHHHHYANPPPPPPPVYQQYPAPSNEYHHYHGASSGYEQGYSSSQGSYYSGGYAAAGGSFQRPNYGDGGYAHYGAYGQAPPPPPPQAVQQGPISAAPLATGHNQVDRGQGAAAVNNIAIIHARSGQSTNLAASESHILPQPLPVGVAEALNMMTDD